MSAAATPSSAGPVPGESGSSHGTPRVLRDFLLLHGVLLVTGGMLMDGGEVSTPAGIYCLTVMAYVRLRVVMARQGWPWFACPRPSVIRDRVTLVVFALLVVAGVVLDPLVVSSFPVLLVVVAVLYLPLQLVLARTFTGDGDWPWSGRLSPGFLCAAVGVVTLLGLLGGAEGLVFMLVLCGVMAAVCMGLHRVMSRRPRRPQLGPAVPSSGTAS